MEYATFVFDSMCTKCKKPSITVLREQKVVLCVVGEEVYKALLFVAGLVFCYSPFWLVLTSLKCVASLDDGEHV